MIKLVMAGASGRMGKIILRLATQDKAFRIVGGLEKRGNAALGHDLGSVIGGGRMGVKVTQDTSAALQQADVLIDFSHFSAVPENLNAAVKAGTGYILGTTGIPEKTLQQIRNASRKIPIVQSPNMSIGVNLLFKLAAVAGKVLDESFDLEITEVHHRMKKDAPSGTALELLDILLKARGRDFKKDVVYGRSGETGAREKGKIGVFALRGGDVVGDHTVSFFGDGERVELVHKASSREAFARGALLAAKFLAKKKQGLYYMPQVLGID